MQNINSHSLPTEEIDYADLWSHVEDLPWCALVTTGRAGTDFLQSLLDSHSEILVFNGQLHFHPFWAIARSTQLKEDLVLEDIVDEFIGANIAKLKSRYDTTERKGQLGADRNQSIDIDVPTFRSHVINFL